MLSTCFQKAGERLASFLPLLFVALITAPQAILELVLALHSCFFWAVPHILVFSCVCVLLCNFLVPIFSCLSMSVCVFDTAGHSLPSFDWVLLMLKEAQQNYDGLCHFLSVFGTKNECSIDCTRAFQEQLQWLH